jgi:hypothetical protein
VCLLTPCFLLKEKKLYTHRNEKMESENSMAKKYIYGDYGSKISNKTDWHVHTLDKIVECSMGGRFGTRWGSFEFIA